MTWKKAFVLPIAILLLIVAAACGGSTHEPQVEASESAEMVPAPLEFTEPPSAPPTEPAAEPESKAPSVPQTTTSVAPPPSPTQSPPATAPPRETMPARPSELGQEGSATVSADQSQNTPVGVSQENQVVVPPSAPRTVSDAPVRRDLSPPSPPQPRYVRIPEGTVIEIRLEERVASNQQRTGDRFKARLDRDIEVDGEVIFPVGTEVVGKILEAEESGRVEGRARMELALDALKRGEEVFSVRTNPIVIEAEGSKGRDAKIIGGAAAVGALIGAITGGKKGAAVGAASGAGAGTAGVLITKGEEVDLPRERLLSFRLEDSMEVQVK